MPTMLFATRSEAKVRELVPIMRELGYTIISLHDAGIAPQADEDGIEAFDSFEENALAKAHWFLRVSNGMPVLADDSGLEVAALDGQPGVRSKRWSGRTDLEGQALDNANNEHLIATLMAVNSLMMGQLGLGMLGASFSFNAQYVCAAACVWPDGERVVRGVTTGQIVSERRGDGGFGYDPYFLSDELQQTFGEVEGSEKARISHRGRAFRSLSIALAKHKLFAESQSKGEAG